MKRHVFAAVFGAILVVLPVSQALRADTALYTVEDLGVLPDGAVPRVTGMNASGDMSGYVTQPSGLPRAARYTASGGWTYVPDVADFYSVTAGINEHGDLVGYQFDGAAFRAFRYANGPGLSLIEPLPGGFMVLGLAIAKDGTVFGQSGSDLGNRAFRAAPGQGAVELTELGNVTAKACGVNDNGQVVGFRETESWGEQAFRLEANGTVTGITAFDGLAASAEACAIDATGRVAGRSTAGGAFRAFTFDAGSPVNVDTLPSSESNIEAIAAGVSAGWFISSLDNAPHAFVNTADGSVDLNTLIAPGSGWTLDQAFAVSANGNIAGIGTLNGEPRAFLLKRVSAADTTAPTITSLSANPAIVQLPNDAMVGVTISATATDDKDPAPVCSVTGIDGHGAAAGDFSVTGPLSGSVRARGGAAYSFAVSCADAAGNAASSSVDVVVPRDTTAPVITSVSANPSAIAPPNGALVPVTVTVRATDNVDATPMCALSSITATSTTADDAVITGSLTAKVRAVGGRTYTLNVKCSDRAGNSSFSAVPVVVPRDTTAPVISSVVATPNVIWPPNGKMVAVSVSVQATDDVDAAPQCSISSIVSNGGAATDAVVNGPFTAHVRADKNNDGSVRIYTVKVACADAAGNKSFCSTSVVVSKDSTSANAALKAFLVRRAVLAQLRAAALKKALGRAGRYFSRGSSR